MKRLGIFIGLLLTLTVAANAQIAQGGVYRIEQSVIAGGGASADATGSTYKLNGVIGEPVAGTTSSSGAFSVKGGFLSSPSIAPTAAAVSISGRILNMSGGGLVNAFVTLTDMNGNARTILTKKFGAFRFDDVTAGESYIITVTSRHYTFQPQVISVLENLTNVDFTAQETTAFN